MTVPSDPNLRVDVIQAPENASFTVQSGHMRRLENGMYEGEFSIEAPPGSGFQLPVTVLASTEREAFMQIAAVGNMFKGIDDRKKFNAKVRQLESVGWMYTGNIDKRSGTIELPVFDDQGNPLRYETHKMDMKDIAFYAKHFGASAYSQTAREPGMSRERFVQGLTRPGARETLLDAVHDRAEEPTPENRQAIQKALNGLAATYPGLVTRIKQANGAETDEEFLNTVTAEQIEQALGAIAEELEDEQKEALLAHANYFHLPDAPEGGFTDWPQLVAQHRLFDALYKHRDINVQELEALYPTWTAESHMEGLQWVRDAFGTAETPRDPTQVAAFLDHEETRRIFGDDIRAVIGAPENAHQLLGRDAPDPQRDVQEWQDTLMFHQNTDPDNNPGLALLLKRAYYDRAAEEEQKNMRDIVRHLVNNRTLQDQEVEEMLGNRDDSVALMRTAWEFRDDASLFARTRPHAATPLPHRE